MKQYLSTRHYLQMKQCFLALVFALSPLTQGMAQRNETHHPRIATLQVVAGTDWLSMPITWLGGSPINIDFDDLTHDYHRYTYQIVHCDAHWQPSDGLNDTDYLQGINGEYVIEDVEQSLNTDRLYTHYHLSIPNANCSLKMSGNYKVIVTDDNTGEEMLTACFMVVDPKMSVALGYDSNTDIDVNKRHQQVSMSVDFGDIRVTNPTQQLKTVVLQNGRWDNAVANAQPDYVSADGLRWRHCRQLIFDAGNVYRKFELLDLDHPTMGIDELSWDGTQYHAYLHTDEPRPSYVHDESPQGSFYIRNSDNQAPTYTCGYAQVHFSLKAPRQAGKVYINGDWTYDELSSQYTMQYDDSTSCYHATLPLKQGYYSYQYLVQQSDGTLRPVSSEGNFYQTQNRYDALVYYRGPGDRCDRLVGWKNVR